MLSACSIVRRLWVMTTNCVCCARSLSAAANRSTLASSSAASTSSRTQKRRWPDLQQGKQQGDRGQCAFTAGEQSERPRLACPEAGREYRLRASRAVQTPQSRRRCWPRSSVNTSSALPPRNMSWKVALEGLVDLPASLSELALDQLLKISLGNTQRGFGPVRDRRSATPCPASGSVRMQTRAPLPGQQDPVGGAWLATPGRSA